VVCVPRRIRPIISRRRPDRVRPGQTGSDTGQPPSRGILGDRFCHDIFRGDSMRPFRFPMVRARHRRADSHHPQQQACRRSDECPELRSPSRRHRASRSRTRCKLIAADATIEVLAGGYDWTEGRSGSRTADTCCSPTSRRTRSIAGTGRRGEALPHAVRLYGDDEAGRGGRLERTDTGLVRAGCSWRSTATARSRAWTHRSTSRNRSSCRLRTSIPAARFNSPNDLTVKSNGDI
jgi:hypothetical protein